LKKLQGMVVIVRKPHIADAVHGFIATANGQAWYDRYTKIREIISPDVLRKCVAEGDTDSTGFDNYARPSSEDNATRYDVVTNWQGNYLNATCNLDGTLVAVNKSVLNDDSLMGSFYGGRSQCKALDIGCNTGKNMMFAVNHSNGTVEPYGIEYSPDSAELAAKVFGTDHVIQGDAAGNYVIRRHSRESSYLLIAHLSYSTCLQRLWMWR